MDTNVASVIGLDCLPDELCLLILSHVSLRDLAAGIGRVDRRWCSLSRDVSLLRGRPATIRSNAAAADIVHAMKAWPFQILSYTGACVDALAAGLCARDESGGGGVYALECRRHLLDAAQRGRTTTEETLRRIVRALSSLKLVYHGGRVDSDDNDDDPAWQYDDGLGRSHLEYSENEDNNVWTLHDVVDRALHCDLRMFHGRRLTLVCGATFVPRSQWMKILRRPRLQHLHSLRLVAEGTGIEAFCAAIRASRARVKHGAFQLLPSLTRLCLESSSSQRTLRPSVNLCADIDATLSTLRVVRLVRVIIVSTHDDFATAAETRVAPRFEALVLRGCSYRGTLLSHYVARVVKLLVAASPSEACAVLRTASGRTDNDDERRHLTPLPLLASFSLQVGGSKSVDVDAHVARLLARATATLTTLTLAPCLTVGKRSVEAREKLPNLRNVTWTCIC